ncbi:MAG: hypothetical protein WC718_09380 [Phycisphaerales bacterium]|jgi:hypothetical protein
MKRMIRSACVMMAALAGVAAAAPHARADLLRIDDDSIPRVLLDSKLNASLVRLVSISQDSVTVRSDTGKPTTYPRGSVLAILPVVEGVTHEVVQEATERDLAAPLGRLELVTGELLPGQISTQPATGEKLAWESHVWGRLEVPLERAAFVLLQPQSPYASRRPTGSADAAVLANGDTVEGFVAALGESLKLERDHAQSTLPVGRVVSVAFANPPVPALGEWCWLHDGSAVAIANLEVSTNGEMRLAGVAKGNTAALRAGELRAIVFDSGRLVPLSRLPLSVGDANPARVWTQPPVVGDWREAPAFAADITLPGPMTVRFALPKGAVRVGGEAQLPANCRVWGDCELLVGRAGGTTTRIRLNSETPEANFSVDVSGLDGGEIEISIDPGPSGPVQDRVILRRAMVMLGK